MISDFRRDLNIV